jgi:uncharacterized protein YndB with AHSA1/START domain
VVSDGLRLTRRYAGAPIEVWAALSDPELLGRSSAIPAVGVIELWQDGRIELDELPDEGRVRSRVRQIDPGRLLELDWCFGDEEPSIVRLEFAEDGWETELVLEHSQIEEPLRTVYLARWTGVFDRLASEIQESPNNPAAAGVGLGPSS